MPTMQREENFARVLIVASTRLDDPNFDGTTVMLFDGHGHVMGVDEK